jgi:hypothetical protein
MYVYSCTYRQAQSIKTGNWNTSVHSELALILYILEQYLNAFTGNVTGQVLNILNGHVKDSVDFIKS